MSALKQRLPIWLCLLVLLACRDLAAAYRDSAFIGYTEKPSKTYYGITLVAALDFCRACCSSSDRCCRCLAGVVTIKSAVGDVSPSQHFTRHFCGHLRRHMRCLNQPPPATVHLRCSDHSWTAGLMHWLASDPWPWPIINDMCCADQHTAIEQPSSTHRQARVRASKEQRMPNLQVLQE